ncbi:MAG: flagellar motor stator protein MotA [Candidatus Solibacter sp.]
MLALIGIALVIGAILGGYLMEHGPLLVLVQPAELLIILGAAIGTMLIANPLPVVLRLLKDILGVFKGDARNKAFYLENLKMLNELFGYARKNGLPKLEGDVDEPAKSSIFTKYPKFLKDHHAVHFICDTLRMFISGGVDSFELDQMMELDMEVHHNEAQAPVTALSTTADALPGLGIVAAVLGIVITMGALGGPPEEIGKKVGAALVGTFLGILLCYGFFGPIAARMAVINTSEGQYYHVVRVGVMAFIRGSAPILAVEFARRAIPSSVRPTFKELEATCRRGAGTASPEAAAA